MKFVSKAFIERCAYSALFDPAPTEKRLPRWQRREKIRPRRTLRLQDPIDAGTDLPEGRAPLVHVKTPWYKKRVDAGKPSS